jgi:hypothetical protein
MVSLALPIELIPIFDLKVFDRLGSGKNKLHKLGGSAE